MILRVGVAAALCLALGATASALDPQHAISQYVLTKWGVRELSSNSIHALLQTRDHYIWLGSPAGLVRFDGARFVRIDRQTVRTSQRGPEEPRSAAPATSPTSGPVPSPAQTPASGQASSEDPPQPPLGDSGVASLSEAPDGTLYVGTTSGDVGQYRDGTLTRLDTPIGAGFVFSLCAARDGMLWVGVHGRPMYRWNGKHFRSYVADPIGRMVNPLAILEDSRGVIWFGTSSGVAKFEGGKFLPFEATQDTVQALRFSRSGALWIGTPHGLIRVDGERRTLFSRRDGLLNENVTAILEDRDGNLWVGTAGGGLFRWTAGRFTRFTTGEGLSNDHVRCLLEDHEGNLWVGTADGLNCLSDGRFVTYGRPEGVLDPTVTATTGAPDGDVWLGTNSTDLVRLSQGKIAEVVRLPGGLGRGAVLALHADRVGGLWIAVDNGRLFYHKDRTTSERTPIGPLSRGRVRLILEDDAGPLFCVTGPGLVRLRGHEVVPLHPQAPKIGYAHVAYRDPSGTLWLGTSYGLVRVRGVEYEIYRMSGGLRRHRVRSIAPEADGGLWLATIGGLAYFKDGVFQRATTREGLPEDYLRLLLDDGAGHLWVASMTRVFRVDKQELREVFAGKRNRLSPISFDTADGLRATESVLSNGPGFRTSDGRLWFATAQGLSVVDPSRISFSEPAPPAVIERVTVDGATRQPPEFPPGRGEVTVDFTALAFRASAKLRFRHRLEGFDGDWTGHDAQRTAYYSNLPPGDYRFLVAASNRDGLWTGPVASYAFSIEPHFYQTTVFYLLCAAGLLGLVVAGHRLRVRQMEARFGAILHERTRIARELHDTLAQGLAGVGIQIDSTLSILPDEDRLSRVREQIELACSMIRTSLNEVRRSIWVLRAQTVRDANNLPSALAESLTQLTGDTQIALEFSASGQPRPLGSDLESNLLRIAHEAVLNAVRHSGAHRIRVDLRFERDGISLRVEDDGQGFDPSAHTGSNNGQHFGLVGVSERARSLGGELSVASRSRAGTTIECRLPYRKKRIQVPEVTEIRGASL